MKSKFVNEKYWFVIVLFLIGSCTSDSNSIDESQVPKSQVQLVKNEVEKIFSPRNTVYPKDRVKIKERLQQKIKNKEPLIIHTFVPLCDNDNQGIVPVSKSLGDGFNLRTNLYWGALYGVKTHFKKQKTWKLLFSKKDLTSDVLERVVFYKKFSNGAEVYLVADAYRGDRMKKCLTDYFDALSGESKSEYVFLDKKIGIAGNADLIVFNGHNGLMDTKVKMPTATNTIAKDAISVACISFEYFDKFYQQVNAFPLLCTNNLLAPEAYVLENVFNSWAMLKDEKDIHHAAGSAYNQYQKCGLRGAKRLFKSGW